MKTFIKWDADSERKAKIQQCRYQSLFQFYYFHYSSDP